MLRVACSRLQGFIKHDAGSTLDDLRQGFRRNDLLPETYLKGIRGSSQWWRYKQGDSDSSRAYGLSIERLDIWLAQIQHSSHVA